MATVHGRGGMVYLAPANGSAAVQVLNARSWKLTLDRAFDENNKFGDAWVTQLLGLMKWTGSVEGNLDTADTGEFNAATATGVVNMYFYPVNSSTTRYYYGTVWPKLDITVTLDATERYTLDFEGDGQLAVN